MRLSKKHHPAILPHSPCHPVCAQLRTTASVILRDHYRLDRSRNTSPCHMPVGRHCPVQPSWPRFFQDTFGTIQSMLKAEGCTTSVTRKWKTCGLTMKANGQLVLELRGRHVIAVSLQWKDCQPGRSSTLHDRFRVRCCGAGKLARSRSDELAWSAFLLAAEVERMDTQCV